MIIHKGVSIGSDRKRPLTTASLKNQYPSIYEAVFQDGVKAEKTRIMALLDLGACGPSSERVAMEAIISSKSIAELEPQFLAARRRDNSPENDDTPPDVATGTCRSGSGETMEGGTELSKAELDAFRAKIRKLG